MRNKPCITIIIAGASNREPGLDWLFQQEVTKLHASGIGVVSCAALPCDQTFAEKLDLDTLNYLIVKPLIQKPKIDALLQRDPNFARPYFPLEKFPALVEALTLYIPNNPQLHAEYLLNFYAFYQAIQYGETLKTLRIPYQGLERPARDHASVGRNIRANAGFFQQDQPDRIEFMTQKICQDALGKAHGKNTIILCHVGILVAQRLAASVLHWIQTHDTDFDINVLPLLCYSNSTKDTVEQYRQQIRDSQGNDPAHIQALYPTFATPIIELHEQSNGDYQSKTFGHILALARCHVAPDRVHLTDELIKTIENELSSLDIGYKPPRSCCGCVVL